jgi:hypothetical protein
MAMSMGNVFAQGILRGIVGAGQGAAKVAEDEMRAEMERLREERLSKLRLQEYRAKGKIDIEMAPEKARVDREAKVAEQGALTPGIIDRSRQQKRAEKEVEGEFADQDAKREGAKARARAEAEEPFKAADDRRRADEQIRVTQASAAEARKNNWRVDEEGFYVDGDGERVKRSQRVEGRTVDVFVKAPESKTRGRDVVGMEELDSLNRRIETAERNGDTERVKELEREKERLVRTLGRAPSSSASASSSGGKPWERKWGN